MYLRNVSLFLKGISLKRLFISACLRRLELSTCLDHFVFSYSYIKQEIMQSLQIKKCERTGFLNSNHALNNITNCTETILLYFSFYAVTFFQSLLVDKAACILSCFISHNFMLFMFQRPLFFLFELGICFLKCGNFRILLYFKWY